MIQKLLVVAVFATALIFPSSPAPAANLSQPVPGTVIVARMHGTALLIWDCTHELTDLVTQKASAPEMLKAIQADAVRVLAQKRSIVAKTASRMSLRVIYNRIGDINPAYGSPTLQGVERLMTVAAKTNDVSKNASFWIDQISKGRVPRDLSIQISGKVPGQ